LEQTFERPIVTFILKKPWNKTKKYFKYKTAPLVFSIKLGWFIS